MLTVTEKAFEQIQRVQTQENTTDPLRVYVKGGGCSGFQYGFTFEERPPGDDDYVITSDTGIRVIVDAMSMSYLSGAEIDYKRDLMSEQFVIRNPNVTNTCGCGSSFQV